MQDPLIQFVATAIVFFFSGFVMGVLLGWLLRLLATQGRRT